MGVRFDRLRYEVFQNLFLSPMNTGSVRPAVATTPTACGIETITEYCLHSAANAQKLQQHLPLAVLKRPVNSVVFLISATFVATTPTACGIETFCLFSISCEKCLTLQQHLPLAVLKQTFQ